jgi:hypothetical protein
MTIVGVQNFSNALKYPENIQNDFFKSENVRVLYKNENAQYFWVLCSNENVRNFNVQKISGFCIYKMKCPEFFNIQNKVAGHT